MIKSAVPIPDTDLELRRANMALVQRYIELAGWDRLHRDELYSDDHSGGLYTLASGMPAKFETDKSAKNEFDKRITALYPDWTHSELVIYQTLDPSIYLATGRGFGYAVAPEHGTPYYENFFIHYFRIENGKIVEYHENMNPCVMLKAFQIDIPTIKRPQRERKYLDEKTLEGI